MKTLILLVAIASAMASTKAEVPGVPADTVSQAAKVAWDARREALRCEDYSQSVQLEAQAEQILKKITEIESQPVTGNPADAEKKLISLKALRDLARLDEPQKTEAPEMRKKRERELAAEEKRKSAALKVYLENAAQKKSSEEVAAQKETQFEEAIKNHSVMIGMTGDQVRQALGNPTDARRSVTERGNRDTWYYGLFWVNFDAGRVLSFGN